LQRQILASLLRLIPTHAAAHGFVPGRSPHSFAAPHGGRRMVIRLDVTSFFAAVSARRVYGMLRAAGFPEPVAHTLTGLCTTVTPPSVLTHAPASVPNRDYRLALLRAPHLPQGAPTSPALANLCGFHLDRRLTGLAARYGARYTRYADDLAFSGPLSPTSASMKASASTRRRPASVVPRTASNWPDSSSTQRPRHRATNTTRYERCCTTRSAPDSTSKTVKATPISPPTSPDASPGSATTTQPARPNSRHSLRRSQACIRDLHQSRRRFTSLRPPAA
jgi:hypothetical protein